MYSTTQSMKKSTDNSFSVKFVFQDQITITHSMADLISVFIALGSYGGLIGLIFKTLGSLIQSKYRNYQAKTIQTFHELRKPNSETKPNKLKKFFQGIMSWFKSSDEQRKWRAKLASKLNYI